MKKSSSKAISVAPKQQFSTMKVKKPTGSGSGIVPRGIVGRPRAPRLNPDAKVIDPGQMRVPVLNASDRKRVGK